MKRTAVYFLFPLVLSACATPTAGKDVHEPVPTREVNRAAAIASAREDASRNYGTVGGSLIDAHYGGGYWVVELLGSGGATLHYAISARDGSVKQRAVLQ